MKTFSASRFARHTLVLLVLALIAAVPALGIDRVADFTATAGDAHVDLSWTNPGDYYLAGVKILRSTTDFPMSPTEGTVIYDGLGTEVTDGPLTNGTRHFYAAYTYDTEARYSYGVLADTYPGVQPCCGPVTGYAGRAILEQWATAHGGTLIDFDGLAAGTKLDTELQATHGVTFWTTKDSNGNPLGTPHNVVLNVANNDGQIIGTPSIYSGADGRYPYEVRFDVPQRWAGLDRVWSGWNANCITRFFSPSGALLGEVNGFPEKFAGYIACSMDTNQWVSRIECDGLVVSGSRQVGLSDNVIFGIGPATVAPETWRYAYPNPGGDSAFDTAVDSQGNIYVAGGYTDTGDAKHDAILFKAIPGNATYEWVVYRSKPGHDWYDRYHAVCVDDQGNAIVAGRLGQNSSPYTESVVAKYTPNGSNLWEHVWHKSGGTEAIAFDMDMAPDGTMYAACHVDVSAHNYILWGVLEYAPTGFVGEVAAATYDNSATTYTYRNYPTGIAVADDHRLCVVGRSGDSARERVNWHVRYHNADHTLRWDDTIATEVAGKSAYAERVALDADGNPVVVGYLVAPSGRNDALAVKYDAANGDVLWSRRCARGTGSLFMDVKVDGVGDVYVAGYCVKDGGARARLLKLEGGTGEVLADQLWGDERMDFRAVDLGPGGIACGGGSSSDVSVVWLDMPDTVAPQITLSGDNPLDLARGTAFVEPGYVATDDMDGDISGSVTVTGSVDHATVGTYTLHYNVSDAAGNAATERVRTVRVADLTPPEIVLQGDNPLELEAGTAYTEPGYSATDDVDGDLAGNVAESGNINHTAVGTYTRYYDVSDAAGNDATQQARTVNVVDTTPPSITLLGDNPVELERDTAYVEPGYTAADPVFGDVSAGVTVTGSVDHTTIGTYALHYNVMDAEGNPAPEQVRTVNVIEPLTGPPPAPNPIGPSGTITDRTPDFTWDPAARAVWYQLVIEKDGKSYFKKWFKGVTTWTPSWNLKPGNYAWKTRAWNPDGFGPWSAMAMFDIPAMIPGKPDLYDPSGTIHTGLPVFDWEDDKDAVWSHLIVTRSGKSAIDRWIQNDSEYIPTLAEALRYGYYTWYVRGWGLDGLGPWSDPQTFDYGAIEGYDPEGLVQGTLRPDFDWTELIDATYYHLWVARNGKTYRDLWLQVPEWMPPADLPFGVYIWSVQGYNAQGQGPWSDVLEFAIGEAVPMSPMGAQLGAPTHVGWDDSGCEGAGWYRFWIGGKGYTLASFWVRAADTYTMGGKVFADIPAVYQPIPPGNHYWQMRVWSPSGMGPWSEGLDFSVP